MCLLVIEKACRPELDLKAANVELPMCMKQALNKDEKRFGVARQSLIKIEVAERLKKCGS